MTFWEKIAEAKEVYAQAKEYYTKESMRGDVLLKLRTHEKAIEEKYLNTVAKSARFSSAEVARANKHQDLTKLYGDNRAPDPLPEQTTWWTKMAKNMSAFFNNKKRTGPEADVIESLDVYLNHEYKENLKLAHSPEAQKAYATHARENRIPEEKAKAEQEFTEKNGRELCGANEIRKKGVEVVAERFLEEKSKLRKELCEPELQRIAEARAERERTPEPQAPENQTPEMEVEPIQAQEPRKEQQVEIEDKKLEQPEEVQDLSKTEMSFHAFSKKHGPAKKIEVEQNKSGKSNEIPQKSFPTTGGRKL
ncbi:MAG: hypothetical protein R3Y07_00005 [Eubacteriales bacterium]